MFLDELRVGPPDGSAVLLLCNTAIGLTVELWGEEGRRGRWEEGEGGRGRWEEGERGEEEEGKRERVGKRKRVQLVNSMSCDSQFRSHVRQSDHPLEHPHHKTNATCTTHTQSLTPRSIPAATHKCHVYYTVHTHNQ